MQNSVSSVLRKVTLSALLLAIGVFLWLAMISHHQNDNGWTQVTTHTTESLNLMGQSGAWFSDIFFALFGLATWLVPVFFVYELLNIWILKNKTDIKFRLSSVVFCFISLSVVFALMFGAETSTSALSTRTLAQQGGIIGYEISNGLLAVIGKIPSLLFTLIFSIFTFTFSFGVNWKKLFSFFNDSVTNPTVVIEHRKMADAQAETTQTNRTNLLATKQAKSTLDADHIQTSHSNQTEQVSLSDELTDANIEDLVPHSSTDISRIQDAVSPSNFKINSANTDKTTQTQKIEPMFGTESDDLNHTSLDNINTSHQQNINQTPASVKQTDYLNHLLDATQEIKTTNPVDLNQTNQKISHAQSMNHSSIEQNQLASNNHAQSNDIEGNHTSTNTLPNHLAQNNTDALHQTSVQTNHSDNLTHPNQANDSLRSHDNNMAHDLARDLAVKTKPLNPITEAMTKEPSNVINDKSADSVSVNSVSDESIPVTNTNNQPNNRLQTSASKSVTSHETNHQSSHQPNHANKQVESYAFTTQNITNADNTGDLKPQVDTPVTPTTETKTQVETQVPQITSTPSTHKNQVALEAMPFNQPVQAQPSKTNTQLEDLTPKSQDAISAHIPEQQNSTDKVSLASSNTINTPIQEQPNNPTNTVAEQANPKSDLDLFTQTKGSRAMATLAHRQSLTPLPSIELLDKPDPNRQPSYTQEELMRLSELLEIKLGEFNVSATVQHALMGPVVTRFEVELAAGVKVSKVTGIARDLARSLSMASVRVVEVIPGKPYIGIEVPNQKREMVRLYELITTPEFTNPKAGLSMAIGKNIGGKPVVTDLAKAPHMLVAGTTGSGKSVAVNCMLLSLLLKYKPDELRLILIDPKQLELANYNEIPHLLAEVVTDMKDAASALNWCVLEMERRYKLMAFLKVRKLSDYNKKIIQAEASGEDFLDPLWRPNDSVSVDKPPRLKPLPAIVVVADEFADMIMQVGKQAEELITRLAQKSRAAGIHLILATQRPSVDVITGLIKANVPTRVALRVNSKVDSRTILDTGGAEDMLGNGDMLFLGPGQIEPIRAHGAFIADHEVNTICDAWRERGSPDYVEDMFNDFVEESSSSERSSGGKSGEEDVFFDEAVAFVMETRKVSASSIQRKFSIGYNRAARIVDAMESTGLVGPMGKNGKRDILM